MAEVWSGVHAAQGVPVAVKVMTGERAREATFRDAFRNEVQAVASLDHPGIVIVFDHGEIGPDAEEVSRGLLPAGSPALAMELADGGTLAGLLAEGMAWPAIRRVLLDLLDALAHAHARGVVHRDLKPNNILLFRQAEGPPRLKLADFGLAQAIELQTRNDSTEVICGTPTYMAPEQLRGRWRDYGAWTDLYAVGCLAWTMATGTAPFGGLGLLATVRMQMEDDPPAFKPREPMPRGFEGWLRRMLQKDAGRRFVRAADAAWALLELRSGEPGAGAPPRSLGALAGLELDEPTTHNISLDGLWSSEARDGARSDEPTQEPPVPRRSPPLPATWERPEPAKPSLKLIGAGLGLYGLRSIPLLGRREERDVLWQELARVHDEGRTRLVVLRGVAGTGKTHLGEWLAERAHEVGGAIVLRGYHGPNPAAEDGLPRMMARHLRCVGLSREEVLKRTEALLRTRKVTDPREWTALTDLMFPGGSRQTAPERFALLERHLRRLNRQRPVVVLLDDAQWGAESLDFVRHLLESREDENPLAVLLLLTVRDEALAERPAEAGALEALLNHADATEVEVPPLPPEDRARLTRDVLGLSNELAQVVDARTAGNPLFAVQLVGDWVERGVIEVGGTGFVLRPGAHAALPDDLHEVWSARVERLLEGQPEGAREALEMAATLSPFVDRKEWEAACAAAGVEIPPGLLDDLVTSRLALRTEEGWSFVHAMLRESVERRAREAGRFAAHNYACASMLLPRAQAGERGLAERLGHHLLLAGEREAALGPLLEGARERRGLSDYPAAQALLAEREETLKELGVPGDDPRWGEGWVVRARIHLHQGRLEDVFRWAEPVASAEQMAPWWGPIRSEAFRLLGDASRRQGNLDHAAHLYSLCIALPEAPHSCAASLWGLGDVARQRGRLEEAGVYFDRSLAMYREIGDEHGVADHGIADADLARQRRDLPRANELYRLAAHRFETLGNRYGVARSLNGIGDIARLQGDFGRAAGHYRRALTILDGLRSADGTFPRLNLALIDLAEQRFALAENTLVEIGESLEELGWGGLLASVHVCLLACMAQARDWSAWDDHLERGIAALGRSGLLDPDVAWAAELGGRLTEWAGQPARAQRAYAVALAQWRGLGDLSGIARLERTGVRE